MTKHISTLDGVWRVGNPSEATAYIGALLPSQQAGGPSVSTLIAEGVMGFGVRATAVDIILDATYGMVQCDCTITVGATTALAGTGTVQTYTVANTLVAGQLVTVTGATPAGYNGTNLLVNTAVAGSFTVLGTTSGAQTVAGTVNLVAGGFRTVYLPVSPIADAGTAWLLKKVDTTNNRIQLASQSGLLVELTPQTTFLGGAGMGSVIGVYSDGTQWRIYDNYDAPSISAVADALATPSTSASGTISPGGVRVKRVNPGAAVTGAIMNITGAVANQEVTVFNESANLITFSATTGTSHVSVASQTIPATSGKRFVYNANSSLWYPS